ncbi:MAG: nitrite/sulfite reductase [Gammaproteobacteria bacterium]|nr:nitrite/sulfite reductase [Gammaproteobacteria bacterium]
MNAAIQNTFEDIARFEQKRHAFERGELFEEDFVASRLQLGVYAQRQSGRFTVRIRVPGGKLARTQLSRIAELGRRYSDKAFVNVTKRRDIQFHFVALENVSSLLRGLAEVGLTTREACGNTICNITTCVLTGVCLVGYVDVQAYVNAIVQYFLRNPDCQHLPRKFRISFSACEQDCAQTLIHDLTFVATKKNERFGFRVYVGGGLGHKLREAVELEAFIDEGNILSVVEAVVNLHNRNSDGSKHAKSRFSDLVERVEAGELRELYKRELKRIEHAVPVIAVGENWREPDEKLIFDFRDLNEVVPQRQTRNVAIPLKLSRGELSFQTIEQLDALLSRYGLQEIRLTQNQNLVLPNVVESQLQDLVKKLERIGLHVPNAENDVVVCPGTWTCRLAIADVREVGKVLSGLHAPSKTIAIY